MPQSLAISLGQYSDKGRKRENQDFYGALLPGQPLLELKGITVALADGISTSMVSSIAAQAAIKSFLTDYYSTPDSWPVKTSAQRVIAATNSWLEAQTRAQGDDVDSGYVCTLSVLVLKSRAAHIFHVGDSRIYRLAGRSLEQLTVDHRVPAGSGRNYLGRALGVAANVEIDYRTLSVSAGDIFVLATDGVHEHVNAALVADAVERCGNDLDGAAALVAGEALQRGSEDNLTIQIVRVDSLPQGEASDYLGQSKELPFPPPLEAGMVLDGHRLVRPLHANSRSHIYLAEELETGRLDVIKVLPHEMRENPAHLQHFMMEEWIARRIDSPHALKCPPSPGRRSCLYSVTEYVEGPTLAQWMIDNPRPELNVVRNLMEQIARGLRAFHRLEMVHQDLRPDNIMIDRTGTVRIIDYGSVRVPGLLEAQPEFGGGEALGALQYIAPEYLLGEFGTEQSDIFSLGVIGYQLLSGHLPYGASAARLSSRTEASRLRYVSLRDHGVDVPEWVDRALEKAVHPDPGQRYEVLSELTYDLRHPNAAFGGGAVRPSRARDPVRQWQILSLALAVAVVVLSVLLLS